MVNFLRTQLCLLQVEALSILIKIIYEEKKLLTFLTLVFILFSNLKFYLAEKFNIITKILFIEKLR
jgi:hypothetical protein